MRGLLCLVVGCSFAAAGAGQPSGRPLGPRSEPTGATMFSAMPAARTGVTIENRFADPRMWWDRYLEFTVGAIGTGVAIGDFDQDGRPDLFVVSKTEPCRLFRNLGDWHFVDVTESAGLQSDASWLQGGVNWAKGIFGGGGDAAGERKVEGWQNGAAWADVNNDGWLDLFVARFNLPNQLWMNQGDGTFVEQGVAAGLGLVDASGMGAFADYDRDGWLDLFVQTNLFSASASPQGQRDHLYRNRGDGTFAEVSDRAGISGVTQGHSVIWWDYDADGWPDLYVANDFSTPDQLWHNERDGTFRNRLEQVVPRTPFSAMGADLGDVNNDGRIDLFVADMAATAWTKDQRGMAESRAKVDPAIDGDRSPQNLRNVLFLNTGTGRMAEVASFAGLPATNWTWSPRWEDLDNDGWLDLHVTNGMVRELHNADLLARTMVTESPTERIRLMKASPVLAEANLAYRNRGDLTFEEVGAKWGLDQRGVSFGSAWGDLDGDGDLDLVYTNYEGDVTLLRNDCTTGHRVIFGLRGTTSNRFGVGATVELETSAGRQVRSLVLSRGYLSTSEPILHFGLGAVDTVRRATVRWPSGVTQTLTDLAADRVYVVTEPAATDPMTVGATDEPRAATGRYTDHAEAWGATVLAADPPLVETALQPLLPWRHNGVGPRLAAGDINGDGRMDLVVGGTTTAPTRVLLNRIAGGFDAVDLVAPGDVRTVNRGPMALVDVDGDGDLDLWETMGGVALELGHPGYQPRLWLNHGRTGFPPSAAPLPSWPQSTGALAIGDFNRDGRPDVFLGARLLPGRYPRPAPAAIWLNAGGGAFRDASGALAPELRTPGLVTAALATDVDGDGWTDLVVALEWGGVRFWRNEGARGLVDRSTEIGFGAVGTGCWRALATGDFNGDGRPDFVVGNLGTNTMYRASRAEPAVLLYGALGGRRGPTLIEAEWADGALRPRVARSTLAAVIPAVGRKYPKVDDYAKAALSDLMDPAQLASALRWEATELRSGVWLSGAGGQYRFAPLPAAAQWAPVNAIAVADENGDGVLDLVVAQNDFGPVPAVGRFDGGLSALLRGDGQGGFQFVDWNESGIVVPGEARDVVATDLDGDGAVEWIVARRNDPLMIFKR